MGKFPHSGPSTSTELRPQTYDRALLVVVAEKYQGSVDIWIRQGHTQYHLHQYLGLSFYLSISLTLLNLKTWGLFDLFRRFKHYGPTSCCYQIYEPIWSIIFYPTCWLWPRLARRVQDKCHVWRMQLYAHRKKSLNIGCRWRVVRYRNFFYWYNETPLARWCGPQDSSLLAGGMVSWGEYCDNNTAPIWGT